MSGIADTSWRGNSSKNPFPSFRLLYPFLYLSIDQFFLSILPSPFMSSTPLPPSLFIALSLSPFFPSFFLSLPLIFFLICPSLYSSLSPQIFPFSLSLFLISSFSFYLSPSSPFSLSKPKSPHSHGRFINLQFLINLQILFHFASGE